MHPIVLTQAKIVGHRGARAEAPENTLGGFRYLRQLGIQKVELDVHLSADKVPMVIHDTTTHRTTGFTGEVNALTKEKLQSLNCVRDFGKTWLHQEPVPTLAEVIQKWDKLEHIQIEVKPLSGAGEREKLCEKLLETCSASQLSADNTVITSSDQDFLEYCGSQTKLPLGLVADSSVKAPIEDATRLGCHLLVLHYLLYTPAMAAACRAANLPVSLWTVNDVEIANQLVERGAETIITDTPQAFLQWIALKTLNS